MQRGKHCTCCNPKSTGDKVRIDLQKWGMRSACGVCPGTQPEGSCEDCEWGGRCDSCMVDPSNSYPGALLHPRTPAPGGMVPARVLARVYLCVFLFGRPEYAFPDTSLLVLQFLGHLLSGSRSQLSSTVS